MSRGTGRIALIASLLVALTIFSLVKAEENNDLWFFNLSVRDGLSESNVECLLQDSLGLIWIGTRDGLNSFDGYTFTKYKYLDGTNSLKKSYISCLYLDIKGNIWIGSIAEGVSIYNYKNRVFLHILDSNNYPVDFNELTIYDIKGDDQGNIWIASHEGLFKYSLDQERITDGFFCGANKPSQKLIIRCLCFDNKNVLWIGTENEGLKICNPNDNTFIDLKRNPLDESSLSSNGIKSLYFEKDSILWIGTMDRGLNRLNTTNYKNRRINIDGAVSNNIKINKILRDRKDELWLCTENYGLKLYDEQNQSVTTYLKQEFQPHGISSNSISEIIEDNNGLLWLGVHFSGLDRFYPKSLGFSLFQHIPNDELSLSDNNIRAFCEDAAHNIWIGTDGGGIDIFDSGFKKVRSLNTGNAPFRFSSNVAMSIVSDRKGNIWIATWGDGLIKYNPSAGSYKQYKNIPNNNSSLSSNYLVNLFCDEDNNLWISCFSEGIVMFHDAKQEFVRINTDEALRNASEVYYIIKILKDTEDNLWLATGGNGLIVHKGNFFYAIRREDANNNSLSSNFVYSIFEDSKKRIWIGTGEKLNLFDRKSNKFIHYGLKEGFMNESIYDIQEDKRGFLWLSTNTGLIRFHPDSNTVQNFDTKYHLQGSQYNANASLKLENGTILFGGIGGFNAFDPEKVTIIKNKPNVILKELLLFNEVQLPGKEGSPLKENISFADQINLTHKQSVFTIEYVGINYLSSDKTEYAYKLEGFNDDWNYVGNKRSATYTNLRPGTYTFKVRARDTNQEWGQDIASLIINQAPPYWKTKLAFVIYFIIIVFTYILFRKVVLTREKEKSAYQFEQYKLKKREELDRLRLRFFTNVSHDLRTPLTLIIAPLERLMKTEANPDKLYQLKVIEKNATRLLKLINQIMDLRRQETGNLKLELTHGDLRRFVEQILESYEDMAKLRNISLTFACSDEEIMMDFDQDKIDKIIFNLLSNAFKYTPDQGSIDISIHRETNVQIELSGASESEANEFVVISVRDNGCGISLEEQDKVFERFYQGGSSSKLKHEGTGIGLSLAKDFVELHKGRIILESEKGVGATFHVYLPVNDSSSGEMAGLAEDENELLSDGIDRVDRQLENELKSKNKPSLLLVEDNIELRSYIARMLSGGYHVFEAENGEKGIQIANKEMPDLIISDLMMPGIDGIELLRELKNNISTNHIPVIILTAKTSDTNRVEGLQAGADDYITKPFNFDVLELKIKNLLEGRKALKEKYMRRVVIEGSEIEIENEDEKFLKKALDIVEARLQDPEFSVEVFSQEIGLSRVHLYRKLHALIDESPGDFIKRIRLKRAAQLLARSKKNVSEICYEVGFKDPVYFAKCFKKAFKKSPSEFQEGDQI